MTGAAGILCAIYLRVHRRAPSAAVDVEAMGAAALLLGDILWMGGRGIEDVVALWLLFPTLTIVGERLELARIAFLDEMVETVVEALSGAAVLGACLLLIAPGSHLVVGPALLGLAVVMAYYDVARRTVRLRGGVRFMAASMLAGYVWLAVAGAVWSLWGLQGLNGAAYEIVIHCITVGFAFSMILAHAPVIIPAIVHRALPYHRLMWLPYVLLHAGLVVRGYPALVAASLRPSSILLLDEHTAALDPKTAAFVLELTDRVVKEGRLTTLMVTHSMRQALDYGTRTVMLHQGQVVLDVSGEERARLEVADLLAMFERTRGEELSDDSLLLG